MPDDNPKPPTTAPLDVEQALELELMQKRAAWKQARARASVFRAVSFLFLFLVIAGALLGLFLFSTSDRRGGPLPDSTAPTPAAVSPSPGSGEARP